MKNKDIKMQEIIPYWNYYQQLIPIEIIQNSVFNLKNIFMWRNYIMATRETYCKKNESAQKIIP